jgi:putative ABC transport system permease protein
MSSLVSHQYLGALLGIASSSLRRHRLRSFLSILGIICGVAAVFATLSVGEGAKREVLAGIRQLGLDNIIIRRIPVQEAGLGGEGAGGNAGLDLDDVALLSAASDTIMDTAYLREVQTLVSGLKSDISPQVVACSASYLSLQGVTVFQGRTMLDSDERQQKLICLVGDALAQELQSYGKLGAYLRMGEQLFRIVGVVKTASSPKRKGEEGGVAQARELGQMIFIPFGTHTYISSAQTPSRDQGLDEVVLKMRSEEAGAELVPLIERTLEISHGSIRDYQLIVPWQLMHQAQRTQKIFNLVLLAIGGISLVVGGIGIMNVLLAGISERTREIGIRRAVGATRNDIVGQFLAESLLLTSIGGIAGIVLGLVLSSSIAGLAGWSVAVAPLTVLIPLLTSVVVGVCSGVYPAIKAGQMDPVQALRSA